MNALAINIKDIKRAMNKNEQYSGVRGDGTYDITFGAYGRQIVITAIPFKQPELHQLEEGDYPVVYTSGIDSTFRTEDYDEMFDFVADMFMSYYQE